MNAAPCGNVLQHAGVRRQDVEQRPGSEALNAILGANDWQRTQQSADVQSLTVTLRGTGLSLPRGHTCQAAGNSVGGNGATFSISTTPLVWWALTSTRGAVRPWL